MCCSHKCVTYKHCILCADCYKSLIRWLIVESWNFMHTAFVTHNIYEYELPPLKSTKWVKLNHRNIEFQNHIAHVQFKRNRGASFQRTSRHILKRTKGSDIHIIVCVYNTLKLFVTLAVLNIILTYNYYSVFYFRSK